MGQKTTAIDRNCSTCHFLIFGGAREPFEKLIALSAEARQKIADRSFFETFNFAENCAYCARDVWSIKKDSEGKEKAKQTIFQARDENCFYFLHYPGMSCVAAKELERRKANRREAERDRELTRENANTARNTAIAAIIVAIASAAIALSAVLWDAHKSFHPCSPSSPATQPSEPSAR